MAVPSTFIEPFTLFVRRSSSMSFGCYNEAGEALELAVDDQVRFKIWSTDDELPDIEASTDTTDSKVIVDDNGVAGETPAEVTCIFHEDDTADLDSSLDYYFELFYVDHSDGDKPKVLARGDVRVMGTATGDTGL